MLRTIWRRLGRHKGILVRAVYDDGRIPVGRKPRKAICAPLVEKPIGQYELPDWSAIERMVQRDCIGGLGGEIVDIIERRGTVVRCGERCCAAVRLLIYCHYPEEGVSDGIWITIYRNPKSPRHFKAHY